MKKVIIILTAIIVLAGCGIQSSFNYKPAADLKEKYKHTVSNDDLIVYYSVLPVGDYKALKMSVQNDARVFMQGLSIVFDECCQERHQGPGTYNYKNLGNLKYKSSKEVIIKLPADASGSIRLNYSYTPVAEDGFLRGNDSFVPMAPNAVHNTIKLLLKN